MKLIKDIRIYRSQTENIAGSSMPAQFSNYALHITAHRIAMKLRENGFSLGDFDHLYINLTTCPVADRLAPSKRGSDPFHKWYREYDAEISPQFYDTLETPQCIRPVTEILEQVLLKFFCTPQYDPELIHACISDALTQGAQMLVKYKEKQAAERKAILYLRYLDNGRYFPLLRVYDADDTLLLEQDLPETNHLDAYGTIRLSAKKVTIQPKKSAYAQTPEPLTFFIP